MEFTQDEIAAIIGAQQMEIIALRRELAKMQAKLPIPTEVAPKLAAVD